MATLFDIVGEFQQLYLMLTEQTDDEEVEQVIADTLEAVKGELEIKAEGYVNIIKQMEMEQTKCEELEYEWHEKAIRRKNAISRLKKALCEALIATEQQNGISAGDYTIKVVKNGGVAPIIYEDETAIPQNLMKVKYEKDSKLIRDYLTEHPECEWGHIGERGSHLAIK